MPTCYITFTSNDEVEYAYRCGGLRPTRGDLVVIEVGKEGKLKIVPCTRISEDEDPRATKEIYGLIVPQPAAPSVPPTLESL
jgi:hypothetical protein